MRNCDVVLVYGYTSVTLYAVLFKKPIVFLDYYDKYSDKKLFFDENLMAVCTNPAEISNAIKISKDKIITKEGRAKYFQKYFGIFDGKSSDRAAENIIKLTLKHQN